MFTSKKALYLNKDFDRISPITNIDTLYYELAEKSKDIDSSYIIKRRSVGKHLPIKFDISTLAERTYEDIGVTESNVPIKDTCLGSKYLDVCVNINYNKNPIVNPLNLGDNKPIYKFQQYTIDTKDYVNIQELLKYYEPRDLFSTSIGVISSGLDNINSSITNISNYIDDTSKVAKAFMSEVSSYTTYYNESTDINGSNNGIYNLIYQPNDNTSCIIKVLCISTNTIKNIISLDRAFNHSMDVSVELWVFHYDVGSDKITYLKDEYENEGSFDFRMAYQIYSKDFTNSSFINNKLYFEPENANIKFEGDGKFEGNEIYNSFNITFTGNATNNIVVNSSNVSISGSGNKIYNSINTSTLIIKNSNNTIINCENCSILVGGNSNYIVNIKNQNVSLGNNNTIIGDIEGCPTNTSTFNNSKLFLTNAVYTALSLDLTDYKTVFGDTSVYFGGIVTTDKYYKY